MDATADHPPDRVTIVEVGPRDGLQNEPVVLPAPTKIELITRLAGCGLEAIEVASFVRADRVPQLADGDLVAPAVAAVPRRIALTPNSSGVARAVAAGVTEAAVFVAVSDTFNRRNINRSTDAALEGLAPAIAAAKEHGLRVRGYVSTVIACPHEGRVAPRDVAQLAATLVRLGADELSLGDTIGRGNPSQVVAVVDEVAATVPVEHLAVHMHDTFGMGLANSLAAVERGVRTVDTSVAGLGGCPFAGTGANGNLATEDLVYALRGSRHDTGVDLDRLLDVSWWISGCLDRTPSSRVAQALRPR